MSSTSSSSQFVHASWTASSAGIPLFRAFGDPDDGLRLTVLIADRLAREVPDGQDEVRACKAPRISWGERLDALRRLLDRAPRPSNRPYLGVLVDLDALYPGRLNARRLWKDRGFNAQRGALFEVLRDAIERGGWLVLRPNPRLEVSEQLPPSLVSEARGPDLTDPSVRELENVARDIGSDFRPVLAWLVGTKNALHLDDLREILATHGPDGVETHALMLAYELLKPSEQRAGQRLSALRGPQQMNGALGGFGLIREAPLGVSRMEAALALEAVNEEPWIDARAVDALMACGFLQAVDPSARQAILQIPSPIRAFLRGLARLEDPDQWSFDNRSLGARPFEPHQTPIGALPIDEQLEVHHHAVEGGNLEDARRTALYYGADLRGLAFRMSIEKRYGEAARVYQIILDEFDPEDAYAWEYLGYNLVRDVDRRIKSGGSPLDQTERERILKGYETAASKAHANPLYDGRLLGFRAQLGEPIGARFDEIMRSYRETSRWKKPAMNYFAKAVFDGLRRGGQIEEHDALSRRWRKDLEVIDYLGAQHGE